MAWVSPDSLPESLSWLPERWNEMVERIEELEEENKKLWWMYNKAGMELNLMMHNGELPDRMKMRAYSYLWPFNEFECRWNEGEREEEPG